MMSEALALYFGQKTYPDHQRIKIGTTMSLEQRFRSHVDDTRDLGGTFDPICAVKAKPKDEHWLKTKWKSHSFDGRTEEFRPVPEITDYINWLKNHYAVWLPSDSFEYFDGLPLVSSAEWRPGGKRYKPNGGRPSFGMMSDALQDDDFWTPIEIITCVQRLYDGRIGLDPASSRAANKDVRAETIYTMQDDGLNMPWEGRVWLNPPHGEWPKWIGKIVGEWQSGAIDEMCVLCQTRTLSQKCVRYMLSLASCFAISHGRFKFRGTRAGISADDGTAVIYFGDRIDAFKRCFKRISNVVAVID